MALLDLRAMPVFSGLLLNEWACWLQERNVGVTTLAYKESRETRVGSWDRSDNESQ